MDFDIAIIGGGIAGLSAANAIMTNTNLSLALIEGKDIGSNNPSPLTFLDILEAHDLSNCIKEKYSSFSFQNFHGSSIKYLFLNKTLAVLDYKKACAKIFNRLNTVRNNFEFFDQYVTGIEKNANKAVVRLTNGSHISTKILIDASGKKQLTPNLMKHHKVSYYSHVYGAFFSDVQIPDANISAYLLPSQELGSGGGWFYSVGKNMASFGYAKITNTPQTDTESLKAIFHVALKNFTPYSNYLEGAKIEHIETGVIPISYINSFVFDNILVVGDAAGMATNWTCMGIEPALKYGKLAGNLSVKAISEDNINELNLFQTQWARENKASFDFVANQVATFWESDHYFWESIIKNDLAYLSPIKLIGRLRNNEHLMKKNQIIGRALKYKVKSIFNKNILNPQDFIIKN
jgi:flavin-dependent dehydrogenase